MTEVGYPILYHFNWILEVSSYLAPDVIYKNPRFFVVFQGIWTWPRPSAFLSQDFFCGLSIIGALNRNNMVLRAFQITRPCDPILNRAVSFQIVVEGWRSWNQVGKHSIRITGSSGVKVVLALERLLSKLRVSQNWAFRSWLNGFLAEERAEAGCLLVGALEWGATGAVSASGNGSGSARAIIINESSWGFVQQAH